MASTRSREKPLSALSAAISEFDFDDARKKLDEIAQNTVRIGSYPNDRNG
jgi:hypothetical protein